MNNKTAKTLRVEERTMERLKKYGKFGDTYNDIIVRIIDKLENKKPKS